MTLSPVYHKVEEKCEDAPALVLLSELGGTLDGSDIQGGNLAGFKLYKGFSLEEIDFPCVQIVATRSEPAETRTERTGNQRLTVEVRVVGNKGDSTTRAGHASAVAAVRDILYASNLVTLLNAAGVDDFNAHFAIPGACARTVYGGNLMTATDIEIRCMPSDAV